MPRLEGEEPEGSGWSGGEGRYEQKLVGPAHLAAASGAALAMVARPEPRFPANVVHTVYFDSPRLRAYAEKTDGDYRKLKYRLRWYAEPATGRAVEDGRAWLEIKARTGSFVTKRRRAVALPAAPDRLSPAAWADLAREWFPGGVQPACWLSYRRDRLLSLDGRVRVALDREVRIRWLAAWVCAGPGASTLPVHVVELKGPTLDPGPLLRRTAGRYGRPTGFSKYAMCIDHVRGGTAG